MLLFYPIGFFFICAVLILFASMRRACAGLNLGLSSTNYLGRGADGRQDSYTALDLRLDSSTAGDFIDSRALVQSQIGFTDSSYRFLELPEVYVASARRWTAPFQFTFGRKLISWSVLDEAWGAGAFQPRFRWDYLRPQQVGLLGFYQEFTRASFKLVLFYSPIFIPDRGAPLDFADGRVRSISPWVVNPPYEIEVLRKTVPVRYDAQMPPVGEIIRQNTIAAQARIGDGKAFWGSVSYAYKPMNQLLMSYEAYLSNSANGDAHATLYPRVAHHHVAGVDIGTKSPFFESALSFIGDMPDENPILPTLRTSQRVGNMFLLSPSITAYPFAGGAALGSISATYLHVFGKDPADDGYLADGVSREFDSRYPYRSAFLLTAKLPTWRRLTTGLQLLADLGYTGTIVSCTFAYAAARNWKLFLATDVLSSFSDDTIDGTNFIQRYRENDRVTGGVSYAF